LSVRQSRHTDNPNFALAPIQPGSNMTMPPLLIDPQTLPLPILTSETGSFAHNTLAVRIPRIVEETLAQNHFPDEIRRAVQDLHEEILHGRVRGLREETPDKEFWSAVSQEYIGRAWLDVPWFWAETFFYRRMLEATRYFQPGPYYHQDPYRATKQTEIAPQVAPRKVADMLRTLPAGREKRFEVLLYSSLWGNRVDLSYRVAAAHGRTERLEDERANLLVDDSARVWQFLHAAPRRRLAIVEDNAGTELLMDLALVDFLLRENLSEKLVLHLKPQPFFVSDALPQDVDEGLAALTRGAVETRALTERIGAFREAGRLELYTHWFYPTCLFYFQLPNDLLRELRASDLVIVKGDANYRRLLGDAHWDPTTPFAYVTRYFPAPLVALRTLKAEEIVGLSPGLMQDLARIDPNWMVNGKRGVVQARL
jgi:uncharacterized protein with ATP-grasp and redox domains